MSNEYAIVPEDEFSKLQKDVEAVKSNPLGSSKEGKDMVGTLKQLNDSMSGLVNLFNTATDELKMEEHDSALVSERIGPLFDKIENLEKQNEKIAKGIVAVADMIKELKDDINRKENSRERINVSPNPIPPSMAPPIQNNNPVPNNNNNNGINFRTPDILNNPLPGLDSTPGGMPDFGAPSMDMNKPLPMNGSMAPFEMGDSKEKKKMFHF